MPYQKFYLGLLVLSTFIHLYAHTHAHIAQSAGAVEYTDSTSAEE